MTLQQLLLDCFRRLNFTGSPTASMQTRIVAFLNDAQRRVLTSPGMEQLRDDTLTFVALAGTARYNLPPSVAQVRSVAFVGPGPRPGDNPAAAAPTPRRLQALRRDDARRLELGVSSGTPEYYVPIGRQAVAQQPSDPLGVVLRVASTDAADVNPCRAYVEGTTAGGYATTALTTLLTGTTRAQLGATSDVINVTKFWLNTPCVGYVSLYEQTDPDPPYAGIELARIEPGKTNTAYFAIELWPTLPVDPAQTFPATGFRYQVDYARLIPDLVYPTDEPLLPEDFHYLLALMACRREFQFSDDKHRYAQLQLEEQEAMRALRAFVLYPPDYRVRNTDPECDRFLGNNLGTGFPAGRW